MSRCSLLQVITFFICLGILQITKNKQEKKQSKGETVKLSKKGPLFPAYPWSVCKFTIPCLEQDTWPKILLQANILYLLESQMMNTKGKVIGQELYLSYKISEIGFLA